MLAQVSRKAPRVIMLVLLAILLAEVASIGAQKAGWTPHDLAFYLDQNLLSFVRPGLEVKILSAAIQDGRFVVRVKVTDPKGAPLDRLGVSTPGPVSLSFVAAHIPQGQSQYVSYTIRNVTSSITNQTAMQATSDSGGTFAQVGDGEYTYTFGTRPPANLDPTTTHSIGLYARRNLAEFDLGTYGSDDVFNWVPDGSTVTVVRDIALTATCNKCHDPLALHGGSRLSYELCVLCHTPQTSDPDTGNSVDLATMVHKIHRGRSLPSVVAGKPYRIIGNANSVHDYSTVAFPDDVRRCETCHTGASQSKIYLTTPSRRACGACHDNVNFATGENHADLPQVSDNLCANCHIPEGELEFDVSIKGAHTIPSFSKQLPGVNFNLVKVDNGARGQRPSVTFRVTDAKGDILDASAMTSLNLIMAGPNTDYSFYVSETARAATKVGNDHVYTFNRAVEADAKGSYTIGIEGYKNFDLNAGTRKQQTVRDVGMNKMLAFSVDGSAVKARTPIVSAAKCNTCHGALMLHGTFRRDIQYCAMCHTPNQTDVGRRNRPELLPAESVHFKTMIHKIHTGEENTRDFTVYGFGNNPINFNEVLYPGDRRNCAKCHEGVTSQIPIRETALPSLAPRDYITKMEPETASCLSCHTQKYVAAHALTNTSTLLGEACSTCHGPNGQYSVAKAHAR